MKKGFIGILLLMVFTLTLAGCGAADNASDKDQVATGSKPTDTATGPVTVKHNRGEVTLDKPAQRVVVLEWTFTEDLVALGVQPVGNADNANYKVYVTPEAALDSSVVDVGTRNEPNLEAIAALKPDLIISNVDGNEAIYEQLKVSLLRSNII